jgi:hypothetical protein
MTRGEVSLKALTDGEGVPARGLDDLIDWVAEERVGSAVGSFGRAEAEGKFGGKW